MGKNKIAWHEACIKNQEINFHNMLKEYNDFALRVQNAEKDLLLRKKQIREAKKRGLTEFDSEKLLKSKKPDEVPDEEPVDDNPHYNEDEYEN